MAEPSEDLSFAEASEILRSINRERVREAQSFQKFERVIRLALTLDTTIARMTKDRDTVLAELENLRKRFSDLTVQLQTEIATLTQQQHDMEGAYEAERARLDTKIEGLRQSAATQEENIAARAVAAGNEYAEQGRLRQQERERLEAIHQDRVESAQREVRRAQEQVEEANAYLLQLGKSVTARTAAA